MLLACTQTGEEEGKGKYFLWPLKCKHPGILNSHSRGMILTIYKLQPTERVKSFPLIIFNSSAFNGSLIKSQHVLVVL